VSEVVFAHALPHKLSGESHPLLDDPIALVVTLVLFPPLLVTMPLVEVFRPLLGVKPLVEPPTPPPPQFSWSGCCGQARFAGTKPPIPSQPPRSPIVAAATMRILTIPP
jgi:hypothetical protein